MCGLIAWWSPAPIPDVADRLARAMVSLTPRGPDSGHTWVADDCTVALGHRRLAITGRTGDQPLWNADRSVAVLVNGEFYDADALRRRFSDYPFQTTCDSELLLPLYARYRDDPAQVLAHLNGEFAFVLWDRARQRIWAVRDPAGVKPLRWHQDATGLRVASEAKALFATGIQPAWNPDALADALSLQYPQPTATPFAGIHSLAPGESRLFTRDPAALGGWRSTARRYDPWYAAPTLRSPSVGEAAAELAPVLQAAVERRIDTPWPLAVHLSAGLDSSTILALTARHRPGAAHAFSVGFETVPGEVVHDESAVAARTAQQLGVPFTRVGVSRLQMVQAWGAFAHQAEGWAVNGHGVAKCALNAAIAAHGFRVSLTGEGADEALLGYAFLRADDPHVSLDALRAANPVSRGIMLPEGDELDLRPLAASWGAVPTWLRAKASLGARMRPLLDLDWAQSKGALPALLARWQQPEGHRPRHPIQAAAAQWAERALGGYILPTLADGTEAAWGIEGRLPFLDPTVRALTAQWDPQVLFEAGLTKAPLRALLRTWGLAAIADRPKHPFEAPPLAGDPAVRAHLRERWSDASVRRRVPAVAWPAVVAWLDHLSHGTAAAHQHAEPQVALLLSLDTLAEGYAL
jgi:asparagine synthase (glutamine-hydrolysing)